MNVYTLVHKHYEGYKPFYFVAPEGATEQDFNSLCNMLIEVASDSLIEKGRPLIGWSDIVTEIAYILPSHGYTPIKFHEVVMWGDAIGGSYNSIPYEEADEKRLSESVYSRIQEHNLKGVAS